MTKDELVRRLRDIEDWLADLGGVTSDAFARTVSEAASFIEHSAKEVGPVTGRAWLDFHPADRLPDVPKGQMRACIIMHRSKHTGKNFTMPAYYLNAYPLEFEDGCGDEKCEDEHDDGCPVTGWFYDNANFEYENCYYRIEGECLAWALIPDAVAVGAALEAPPAKEVGAVSDEMVERACIAYTQYTGYYVSTKGMRRALEASRIPVVAEARAEPRLPKGFELGRVHNCLVCGGTGEFRSGPCPGCAAPSEFAPAAGVEAYKAENAKHGWTGRGFAFDGGCLNLSRDGSAEFVFDMDEAEPYNEEGKDLLLAKVPASEVEALRDLFVKAYPVAPAAGVKALTWSGGDGYYQTRNGVIDYFINACNGVRGNWGNTRYYYKSIDDAKAAAQADYETRIRSALVTTPSSPDVELQAEVARLRKELANMRTRYHASMEMGVEEGKKREAAEARASSAVKALEELAEHKTWELDYGERDPNWEGGECGWRVHECSGNINDREWTLIGFGATPREALDAARTTLQSIWGGEDGR